MSEENLEQGTGIKMAEDNSNANSEENSSSEIPSSNLLFSAVQKLDFETVKLALDNGCDPLSLNSDGDNVLSILSSDLLMNGSNENITELISFFLSLPVYKDLNFPDILRNIFHSTLMKLSQDFHVNYKSVVPIISLILKSNIKVNSLIFEVPKLLGLSLFACILKMPNIVDFQGYLIIQAMYGIDKILPSKSTITDYQESSQKLCEIMDILAGLEFSYSNLPINCPTPLTVLLLMEQSILRVKVVNFGVIEKMYTDSGMNVGSSVLEVDEDYGSFSQDIKLIAKLKKEMKVPDVLILYLFKANNEKYFTSDYIPYYWGPPLSLLVFLPEMDSRIFCDWYSRLQSYGKIPHGTLMFNIFDEIINNIYELEFIEESEYPENIDDFLEDYEEYKQIKKTPMTLQELCKYTVRYSVADTASKPSGNNLPSLLHELLPPLLRPVVIH